MEVQVDAPQAQGRPDKRRLLDHGSFGPSLGFRSRCSARLTSIFVLVASSPSIRKPPAHIQTLECDKISGPQGGPTSAHIQRMKVRSAHIKFLTQLLISRRTKIDVSLRWTRCRIVKERL